MAPSTTVAKGRSHRPEPPNQQYCTSPWFLEGREVTQRADELEFEHSKQSQNEGYRAPYYDNMPVTAPSKPELTLAEIEAILRVALPREIQRQTTLDAQRGRANAIVIPDDDEDSLPPPPGTPRQQTNISPAGNDASTFQNGHQLLSPPSMTGKAVHQRASSTGGGTPMKPTVPMTPPTKRKIEASELAGTPQKKSRPHPNPPTPSPSPRYKPIARSQGTPRAVQHSTLNLVAAQSAPRFSQSPQPGFNGAFVGIQLQQNGMQPTRVLPTAFTTPQQPQMAPPRAVANISTQPTRAMPTVFATPQQSHMRQNVSLGAVGDASTQQSRIQSYQQANLPSTPVMRHSYAAQPQLGLSQHQVYSGKLQSTPPQHDTQMVRTMPTGAPTPPQQPHMRQYASPRASATPSQSQVQDLELLALPELQKQTPNGQIRAQVQSHQQSAQTTIAGSPHKCRSSPLPSKQQRSSMLPPAAQHASPMPPIQQLGSSTPAEAQRRLQMPGGPRRGLQMQGGPQSGSPLPPVPQQGSPMLPVQHQSSSLPQVRHQRSPMPPGSQHGSPMPPGQQRGLPIQAAQQCGQPMQQDQQRGSPMQPGQQCESTISSGQQHGLLLQGGPHRGPPMAPEQQHSSPIQPEQQRGFQMQSEHQRGAQMLPGPQQMMHNPSACAQPIQLQNFSNGQKHQAGQQHGSHEPPGQQNYLQMPSGQQKMMHTSSAHAQPTQLQYDHNSQVHQPGQQHGPCHDLCSRPAHQHAGDLDTEPSTATYLADRGDDEGEH